MLSNLITIKALVIANIQSFNLENDFSFKGFNFTSDPSKALSDYDTDKVVNAIGMLHYSDLQFSKSIVYQKAAILINKNDLKSDRKSLIYNVNLIADLFSLGLNNLLDLLWFVKDHSSFTPITHVICDVAPDLDLYFSTFSRNNSWRRNHVGAEDPVVFSSEEFKSIEPFALNLNKILIQSQEKHNLKLPLQLDSTLFYGKISDLNYNTFPRLIRSIYFWEYARSQKQLPPKISFYIGALECLFTTDKDTVTHKVAERAVFFITDVSERRHVLFKEIKTAYKIRSQFMHGGDFNEKEIKKLDLPEISSKIDGLIRDIYIKIFSDEGIIQSFSLKNDALVESFNQLIFGKKN